MREVDLPPSARIHEMVHLFNGCEFPRASPFRGNTEDHIWQGALINAVEGRMGYAPQWPRSLTVESIKRCLDSVEASLHGPREDLFKARSYLLSNLIDQVYYDHGDKAIGKLYRSTIRPHPVAKPSRAMVDAWGSEADKVQALLEVLKKDYKITFAKRTRAALCFP
jgi:hypothetical protein